MTFSASDSHGATISTVSSGTVSAGAATVTLPLPATAYAGLYSIAATYSDAGPSPNFTGAGAQPLTLTLNNPVPAIASLNPSSVQVGAGGTVAVSGTGFVPLSSIRWNGTALATTYVSSTQLSAVIPSQARTGAIDVTVLNTAPGGGTSNGTTFFFTPSGVQATVASGTSTTATGTAATTVGGSGPFAPGSLTGSAVGAGTLTLAQFSSSPVSGPVFGPEGGWFDIHVSPGNSFSVVVVTNCNMGAGHFAYWWTGAHWQIMSKQVYDVATGCNTITFDHTTSPSIAQLNGTEAMVWEWAHNVGLPACIGDEFVGDHGGRLPDSVQELVDWGNATGLRNPGNGDWSCVPNLAGPPQPSSDGWFQASNGSVIHGWADLDSQLRGAGYPGPYDHGSQEIGAYQRACVCTLTPTTPPPNVVCPDGYYMTVNGAKTVAQMRNELAIANYPNWQWASEAEIVSVYGRTSGGAVSLCAPSSPQLKSFA